MTKRFKGLSVTLLLSVCACQGGDDQQQQQGGTEPPSTPPTDPGTSYPHPALDIAIEGPSPAQLAFASTGGTFHAGYLTHSVDIRDGVISITPQSYDRDTQTTTVGGSLTLESTRIGRVDQPPVVLETTSIPTDMTTVDTYRGSAVETVVNRAEGIEQAWKFDKLPEGAGDLEVAVAVRDQKYITTNARGLHFASDKGLGFSYSHATWRDSAGSDWEIEARYVDGQIVMTVPEEIVDQTQFPAILDPTVTAELFTDTVAQGSVGANTQRPDVAGDVTNGYLAVWQDSRDGNDNIYGTRVTGSGGLTDATGIKICTLAGNQQNPRVAFVGTGWLVAWEDRAVTGNVNIGAAFVATNGTVTQLGLVASTAANEIAPALAGRGNEALLAWQSGTDIFAAKFAAGAFAAPFAVANLADSETLPTVAANPAGDYLVAFVDTQATTSDDIRGQRVTSAGALNGAVFNIAAVGGSQTNPSASWNGTNFVVVYNSQTDVFGVRVSTAGTAVDATGVLINNSTGTQLAPRVSCATTGNCFVVWQDNRTFATTSFDVYGALIGSALTPTTNNIVVSAASRSESTPAIALSGTQWLSAWTDARATDVVSAFGARITAAGALSDATGLLLAKNNTRDTAPQMAATTNLWGMFFDSSQNPDYNIVLSRFNIATPPTQLDATPKVISSAVGSQLSPTAAFVGTNWIVAWQDSRNNTTRDIYAARVTPNTGAVIDTNGIAVSTAAGEQLAPKMASAGASALIVWADSRNGNFDIFGAVINSAGAITKTDFPICAGAMDQTRPSVAFDSVHNVYLVVWGDASSGGGDVKGARVDATGTVLDANCGSIISGAANGQGSPALAFGNGQFFVAWEDRRTDSSGDVYGARVTTNGNITVLDTNGVGIATNVNVQQNEPSVAAQGTNFLIAWTDGRNQGTTGLDIWGSRYLSTNTVEANFVISTDAGDEHNSNLTTSTVATTPNLVTYTKARLDLNTLRVQMRQLTFNGGTGQACTANGQCSTGFCVDAKCCDTACGGNVVTDCQACSVARGGSVDGTCGVLPGGSQYVCRNYAQVPGICDVREYCDGTNPLCPPDLGQNAGKACTKVGGGAGVCPANDVSGAPHTCK